MGGFNKVPNIGNVLSRKLSEVGISGIDDLRAAGSRKVFLRLVEADPTVCLNTLYALEGAVQNIRWHQLDNQSKADLKVFFNNLSASRK
jgi:DNA transformation protein